MLVVIFYILLYNHIVISMFSSPSILMMSELKTLSNSISYSHIYLYSISPSKQPNNNIEEKNHPV